MRFKSGNKLWDRSRESSENESEEVWIICESDYNLDSRSFCRRLPSSWLGSPEGSFGPGAVPAGVPAWCRMGVGPDGSGSVCWGRVPLPVRSLSQYSGGCSGRSGSVETTWRQEGDGPETRSEPEGCWRPPVHPGGSSDGTDPRGLNLPPSWETALTLDADEYDLRDRTQKRVRPAGEHEETETRTREKTGLCWCSDRLRTDTDVTESSADVSSLHRWTVRFHRRRIRIRTEVMNRRRTVRWKHQSEISTLNLLLKFFIRGWKILINKIKSFMDEQRPEDWMFTLKSELLL